MCLPCWGEVHQEAILVCERLSYPLGTGQLTPTARLFVGLGPGSEGMGRRLLLAAPSNLHFSLCWEGGGVGGAGELSLTPWA